MTTKAAIAIIHAGGLFPPSSGPMRTFCGLRLPCTSDHFDIVGGKKPPGAQQCKKCAAILEKRNRRQGW